MTTNDRDTQERIAQDHYHDAFYFGTDGTGAAHWWSIYHQAVVAFEADGVTTVEFRADQYLPEYIAWVADERGWADGPRYDESVVRIQINPSQEQD